MTDRKKPGVAFWATVVAVTVLAYPLSIGPATWLEARYSTEDSPSILDSVYRPVLWTAHRSPDFVKNSLEWYLSIGLPAGEDATFDEESIIRGTVL
jgi:hypothetical protein